MRILIAEDNRTSRMLLRKNLTDWGHEVLEAENGERALEILETPDPPRMVLLDWVMPAPDGPEICRWIRRRVEMDPAYIIMITARDGRDSIVEGLNAGADDYIVKPFDPKELRARLDVGQRVLELQSALAAKVKELQEAIDHIKTLRGIIPICMHCHKIRTDQEAWQKIESYLSAHSEARFSHSICPDCMARYYEDENAMAGQSE
jgi:phosphoserine phosphatase RsbU/P